MSNKQTRKTRARVATWLALVALPAGAGVWALKMSTFGIIVIGTWILLLGTAAVNREWNHPIAQRVAKNATIHWVFVVAVIFATGWFARAVHKPALADPEAAENKYVRIKRITPPEAKLQHAILVEFGVEKLNSEGIAVAVTFDGDRWDDWWGEPGRTDKQDEQTGVLQLEGPGVIDGVLRVRYPLFSVTPRKSYYICIMSYQRELAEPNDVIYFAAAVNEKAMASPNRETTGHQYRRKQ